MRLKDTDLTGETGSGMPCTAVIPEQKKQPKKCTILMAENRQLKVHEIP